MYLTSIEPTLGRVRRSISDLKSNSTILES